jgi:hypothetical protein
MDTHSGNGVLTREERINALRDGSWRNRLVAEALEWKFTPYQHMGRKKGVGVDCGGILYEVFNPWLGPFAPYPETYAPDWALHKENEIYLDFLKPYVVQVPRPVLAGISVFQFGRNFSHAAIIVGQDKYLHAYGRNTAGLVKVSPGRFFYKGTRPRPVKHFDVSEQWLSSLSL